MFKTVMRKLDERVFFPFRYTKLTERLIPLLQDVETILDVGTGDGHLAHHIMQAAGCQISGIDVCPQAETYIDVHLYDGQRFPFDDASFDCVMMVDMLHHTDDIDRIIVEAARVARRSIIIKDHYWDTKFDHVALHLADYMGNIPYGVPLPYNYLRLAEWQALFDRHELTELNRSTFKFSRFEPAHHILAMLEPNTAAEAVRVPVFTEPHVVPRVGFAAAFEGRSDSAD